MNLFSIFSYPSYSTKEADRQTDSSFCKVLILNFVSFWAQMMCNRYTRSLSGWVHVFPPEYLTKNSNPLSGNDSYTVKLNILCSCFLPVFPFLYTSIKEIYTLIMDLFALGYSENFCKFFNLPYTHYKVLKQLRSPAVRNSFLPVRNCRCQFHSLCPVQSPILHRMLPKAKPMTNLYM